MSDAQFEAIRRESDPAERARMAGRLIGVYQQRSVELARLRREAIDEAVRDGTVSYSTLAEELGLSKGRIAQIRKSAPTAERALFGVGPVEIWIPERKLDGRRLPVVATEDQDAGERVRQLLERLQFTTRLRHIPADDPEWAPQADAVVICGPKTSPTVKQWLDADPIATFVERDGLWRIKIRPEQRDLASPMANDEGRDLAYFSKVTDDHGHVRIHIAGIHAIGSLAAVDWLDQSAADLWHTMRDRDFTAVISGQHEGLTITRTEAVLPPRPHDQ
ncbi:hypothetical protein [Oryzihumus leptocrescens]|nr:hypothetical protein [Oryzihumus leptocrescens]